MVSGASFSTDIPRAVSNGGIMAASQSIARD
jgi:hypothetical protein